MIDKKKRIQYLISDIIRNTEVESRYRVRAGKNINVGFINQFRKHSFIPNKWFDWKSRVNSHIMIIGQDWGPYSVLQEYILEYKKLKDSNSFNYKDFLFSRYSSRTEKFIFTVLEESYYRKFNKKLDMRVWDDFFFTMAILFTRRGEHFRGNEFFDLKFGIDQSLPYLKRQISIVKPKIIIPFGGSAWNSIRTILNLETFPSKISEVITYLNGEPINIDGIKVIPIFHPASHTDKKLDKQLWSSIWDFYDI